MRIASGLAAVLLLSACASNPSPDPDTGVAAGMPADAMPAGAPILTHTFTQGTGEFVRVDLEDGVTYRAELDRPVRLSISAMDAGTTEPYVNEVLSGRGVSGGSLYEIRPGADGSYQIEIVGGPGTETATLRIFRMPEAEAAPVAPEVPEVPPDTMNP